MITNRQLVVPYALPYLGYVGLASIPAHLVSAEVNYVLRLIVVPLLLVWGWRWYGPLAGPRSPRGSLLVGAVAGLAGLGLWLALLAPFVDREAAAPWSVSGFVLRLLCAGLLVPVFEELLMRGFVLRLALQWDQARRSGDRHALDTALDKRSIDHVPAGEWSWPAILLSTLVFTAGHQPTEWPASIAYGLLMARLWVNRKDLLACIVAHGVTNVALALFVSATGFWHFW